MKSSTKATIICIAFNHGDWIEETLESVRLQEYYDKELIIVDNGSADSTAEKIKNWLGRNELFFPVKTIFKDQPYPYCQLFNEVLFDTHSGYVVDLSGDDILYPEHLRKSIEELSKNREAAFVFSDAYILGENGVINTFYKRNSFQELEEDVEIGNLYYTLLRRNFICSPTMVFNAGILKKEGGYDPDLYYEDFDIQLRLARKYPVIFSDHIGVLKRKHKRSMSADQYKRYFSKMLPSTVKVCQKAFEMNSSQEENEALGERILYELKHALWSANFQSANSLIALGKKINLAGLKFNLYKIWAKYRWDISWVYIRIT
ncbi:glycosyltransferase [Algoriphagus sp. CAU 1675]|uniref:glycosyltransferase n=1 Tax=Algoriphagus sp. CAU 1675 TaxID=3032597 RepID=UPI0023DB0247|nr:glycosyltransferase [Algoriphagus sp. CAU 1675]MDF2157150.1 glycosyltransferase [Algoriphagus sp. CAU 1675]